MLGLIAGLLIAAMLAFGAWVTIVDPELQPDRDESLAATVDCVDNDEQIEEAEQTTEELSEGLGFGRVLGLRSGAQVSAVYFFDSEDQAIRAERELRGIFEDGARERGFREDEIDRLLERRLLRRGFELFIYSGPDRVPTQQTVERFGRCIWAIYSPRFKDFDWLNRRSIGRPFASPDEQPS